MSTSFAMLEILATVATVDLLASLASLDSHLVQMLAATSTLYSKLL
jgi:hypothetical protein